MIKSSLIEISIVIVLLLSSGYYGYTISEDKWLQRIKELESKVAKAEEESTKENVKIVEKVVTKTKLIETRGEDIIKYIDREVVKYDEKFSKGGVCEIPHEFIKALNDAAEEPK